MSTPCSTEPLLSTVPEEDGIQSRHARTFLAEVQFVHCWPEKDSRLGRSADLIAPVRGSVVIEVQPRFSLHPMPPT